MQPACNGAIAREPGGINTNTPFFVVLWLLMPDLKWKVREGKPFEFKLLGAEWKMKSGSGKHVLHQDSLLLLYFTTEKDEMKRGS